MRFDPAHLTPQLRRYPALSLDWLRRVWADWPEMQWLIARELAFRRRWPAGAAGGTGYEPARAALLACHRTRADHCAQATAAPPRDCGACPYAAGPADPFPFPPRDD